MIEVLKLLADAAYVAGIIMIIAVPVGYLRGWWA